MQTAHIHSDAYQAMNNAKKHPTTQTSFKQQLAAATQPARLVHGQAYPIYSNDFLSGNPLLPSKTAEFRPLSSADFKGVAATAAPAELKPLNEADFIPGAKQGPQTQHDKLVQQTQKWVAQTFYGTMLKQMRNSPFKSEIFDGGRGGEAFSTLFDQHLADHMAKGASNKLVNRIVKQIERRQSGKAMAPASSNAGVSPALVSNADSPTATTGFQPALQTTTNP